MSAGLPITPPDSAVTAQRELRALAASTLTALLDLIPRAVWRAVKGGFGGFFLAGLLGLSIAAGSAGAVALHVISQPRWLTLVNLAWVPLVFGVAGAYVGALNGFLSAISDEIERRNLAARLFVVVKPACLAALESARGGSGNDLAGDLRIAVDTEARAGLTEPPTSLGERAERFLAARSSRLLCLSVVHRVGAAKDRGSAMRELESLGVERLQVILVETVEDLFAVQMHVAAALALVAAAAPTLVASILR
jgi:hypothetical protein